MSLNTISIFDKFFLVVAICLGVISTVDFIYNGQHLHDLLMSMGFSLVAYGTYRNGTPKWSATKDYVPSDKAAHYGSAMGLLMIVGAIAARQLV